jgi:hypothetical protein
MTSEARHREREALRLLHQRRQLTRLDKLVFGQKFGAANPGRLLSKEEIEAIEAKLREEGRLT